MDEEDMGEADDEGVSTCVDAGFGADARVHASGDCAY